MQSDIVCSKAARPRVAFRLLAAAGAISLSAALFLTPTVVVLHLAGIAALLWLVKKFADDNRGLLATTGLKRTVGGFAQGLLYFIPFFLVILPGIAAAWTLDWIVGEAIQWLDDFGRKGLPPPPPPPSHWYDPSTWRISLFGDQIHQATEVGMQKTRHWVRSMIIPISYFLGLMSSCAWLIVGFAIVRAYFHFVARVLSLKGDPVTMELPRYQQ